MATERLRLPLARHRLRSRDFARIYRTGRRAHGAVFAVIVLENDLERTRLGLSVSRRCARKAVRRNRVRRIFREAFRLALPELPRGLDVVMVATATEPDPALEDTRRELLLLVHRAQRKKPRGAAARAPAAQDGPS